MRDLLLTHGYFMNEDPKELQIRKPYVPLGILYICSHLRQKGFCVDVFDTTFSSRDDLFRTLQSEKPSVLGIYANLMTRGKVVEILRVARDAGWTTIVGGPEPGAYVDEYLDAGADVVVLGEGEETLEELLPALQSRSSLASIRGICFRDKSGYLVRTGPRPQIADLDPQPWPARDAVDIDAYLRTWREAHGLGSVSLITARGCPYRCRWCSHQVFGQTHRRRNPLLVVNEVEWLLSRYKPDMLWIADDVFTIHHGWIRQYAAEMRRRSLQIPFECITRADRMTDEIADLLAQLGCFRIWIGSESGSQRLLDSMERGVTVEQVQRAVQMCRARKIQSGMFLMWGYEGEDIEDIEATISHVKRTDPDIFFTTVSYPIKGTPYYDRVANNLVQIDPWAQTSDREINVRGRRPREFYDRVDHLLRDEVQLTRLKRRGVSGAEEHELARRIAEARAALFRQEVYA